MYVYFCNCVYILMSFYLCAGAVSGMTRHHQKALLYTYMYVMYEKNKICRVTDPLYIYIYIPLLNKYR